MRWPLGGIILRSFLFVPASNPDMVEKSWNAGADGLIFDLEDAVPEMAKSMAGAFHSSVFPYGPFLAGDGTEVFFGLQNEREWVVFCREVLEQPELSVDARWGRWLVLGVRELAE